MSTTSTTNALRNADSTSRPHRLAGAELALHAQMRIGPYILDAPLGNGGMGTVWRARDVDLGRVVALKMLPLSSDEEERVRFLREAQALARVKHSNVVEVFALGEDVQQHVFYMAQACIDGASLADVLAAQPEQRLDEETALLFCAQAARGLAAAHRVGVFHRDIKPSNLLVDEQATVYVVDFGVAYLQDVLPQTAGFTTQIGIAVGTPHFMAPEQARGQAADAATDVWALGATLYTLLTGHPPFWQEEDDLHDGEVSDADIIARILRDPIPSIRKKCPQIGTQTEILVETMLQKKRNHRFSDVFTDLDEVADQLEACAHVAGVIEEEITEQAEQPEQAEPAGQAEQDEQAAATESSESSESSESRELQENAVHDEESALITSTLPLENPENVAILAKPQKASVFLGVATSLSLFFLVGAGFLYWQETRQLEQARGDLSQKSTLIDVNRQSPIVSPVVSPSVSPVTSPATSPIPSPVTSPVTSPAASPVASPVVSSLLDPKIPLKGSAESDDKPLSENEAMINTLLERALHDDQNGYRARLTLAKMTMTNASDERFLKNALYQIAVTTGEVGDDMIQELLIEQHGAHIDVAERILLEGPVTRVQVVIDALLVLRSTAALEVLSRASRERREPEGRRLALAARQKLFSFEGE